jgi:hypothetical protein
MLINLINRGLWNLPYISGAILIKGELLAKVKISFEDVYLDPVMAFSANLRDKVVI